MISDSLGVDVLNKKSPTQFEFLELDSTFTQLNYPRTQNWVDFDQIMNLDFQFEMTDSISFSTLPLKRKEYWKDSQNLGFDSPEFQRQLRNDVKRAVWVDGINDRQNLRNQGFVVPDGNGVEFQLNKKDK